MKLFVEKFDCIIIEEIGCIYENCLFLLLIIIVFLNRNNIEVMR